MELNEVIATRYSVRAYKPDEIADDKLQQILEAVRLAPSACNYQPYRFIVVHTKGREQELLRVYGEPWFVQAPLVVAAVGLPGESWTRMDAKSYIDIDVAIAMDHLILAAAAAGLGTCWVGAFNPQVAREVLCLPAEAEPVAFTPLGYPADRPRRKRRKALSELVCYERWTAG